MHGCSNACKCECKIVYLHINMVANVYVVNMVVASVCVRFVNVYIYGIVQMLRGNKFIHNHTNSIVSHDNWMIQTLLRMS